MCLTSTKVFKINLMIYWSIHKKPYNVETMILKCGVYSQHLEQTQ